MEYYQHSWYGKIEEEERQQKSTHTIHFYIILLSYWTRVQSLESKWQKYKFFMCCRPATCHYPGFNPSADCMEFTQTFHWIPKHYHQYKVTYRTLERAFPYFDWHFAGGSQCVPRKAISYTFRCVFTLQWTQTFLHNKAQ